MAKAPSKKPMIGPTGCMAVAAAICKEEKLHYNIVSCKMLHGL